MKTSPLPSTMTRSHTGYGAQGLQKGECGGHAIDRPRQCPSASLPLIPLPKMVQPYEPEFEQALAELSQSLTKFLEANPEYKKALEIVQIPERVIQFRVVWEDDQGKSQVNRGYRVQVGCHRDICKVS